jgi:ferritin-like metal-binding protein YciE
MEAEKICLKSEFSFSTNYGVEENMVLSSETGLMELMVNILSEMHYSEQMLLNHLPRLMRSVKTCVLIEALADLMEETKNHILTIGKIFISMDLKPEKTEIISVTEFLIESGRILNFYEKGTELDKALIGEIQKLKRFEIASYFMLSTLALKLDEHEMAIIFQKTAILETEAELKIQGIYNSMSKFYSSAI